MAADNTAAHIGEPTAAGAEALAECPRVAVGSAGRLNRA